MRRALRLARRGYGRTSPNPMVGAVLIKGRHIIGEGWHHGAGLPHAEIEALHDAARRGHSPRGTTLYVTLEPCCTHGRTRPVQTRSSPLESVASWSRRPIPIRCTPDAVSVSSAARESL